MTIRVLIADDQAMIRTGFEMILGAEDDMEVVGTASDGVEALEMVALHRPDVVLMDIRMPRLDGLDALQRINATGAVDPPKVVVVTTFEDDEYVHRALNGGASGFLLKTASSALLLEGVRAAASGEALVSPAITVKLLRNHSPAEPRANRPNPLSAREGEVAQLVATGATNAEISEQLFLSLGTVKTHLSSIQSKLDLRNRVEIAAWVWQSQGVGR
ncbi:MULTISPECIES: response regulator transcription factor [Saccharopolyspora]|uniref:Response regulator transcription factor n=2 Tax=Saccharopolyspora gregorii TaxID=33914 RepID=A0ABP6RXV7_9PSEU|nr:MULTISPECIES: response regulator transcription factor [Saccharopolyspora]MCA1189180.1 response regulator transcription factor [Saccharopolyspora sp. 6T]MCA1196123.1 response regulator transcription factor [Saccharopolyspora sp. 6V]MCA1226700.1 response regulator transcription factor [Saccharopolyspora sp. 6M]MCA1282930.1 response regulator transcription factor [Saccharopolyspora sp. 7B]